MGYQNPRQVKSPKDAVSHLKVIYDGGEQAADHSEWEGWSVAELEWHEEPTMACRWNGSTTNQDVSEIGNPQSRGNATWFIIPRPLQEVIKARLKDAPNADRERELTQGAAEASAPAFAVIWDNPEDDVYEAL